MQLSAQDATILVQRTFPEGDVRPPVVYKGQFLFRVFHPKDKLEGDSDPFFTVNPTTGDIRDFCVLTDGSIADITKLFLAQGGN